jgi:hypothetical protein
VELRLRNTNRVRVCLLEVGLGVVLANTDRSDILEVPLDLGKELGRQSHRVVVELVRENDSSVSGESPGSCVVEDVVLESLSVSPAKASLDKITYVVLLDHRSTQSGHVKVASVVVPDNGLHPELVGNVLHREISIHTRWRWAHTKPATYPDTIVDVTERRTPALDSNTENVVDNHLGVVELGEDLLVGKRRHVSVRPGVCTAEKKGQQMCEPKTTKRRV